MTKTAFQTISTWVFDLDNTLYPPDVRLFDQIEKLMVNFITREIGISESAAHILRDDYWRRHGTTLAGLMAEHDVNPEAFLIEVHALDLSVVPPAPDLRAAIAALPGRKIIYTNGSRAHGEKVSAARGLAGIFDAVYGVEDANYIPKPAAAAFARVFDTDGFDPASAAMFEDDPRNLAVPFDLGMQTVLVGPPRPAPHIHHATNDLTGFLRALQN